jgi:hypothetical protein
MRQVAIATVPQRATDSSQDIGSELVDEGVAGTLIAASRSLDRAAR